MTNDDSISFLIVEPPILERRLFKGFIRKIIIAWASFFVLLFVLGLMTKHIIFFVLIGLIIIVAVYVFNKIDEKYIFKLNYIGILSVQNREIRINDKEIDLLNIRKIIIEYDRPQRSPSSRYFKPPAATYKMVISYIDQGMVCLYIYNKPLEQLNNTSIDNFHEFMLWLNDESSILKNKIKINYN